MKANIRFSMLLLFCIVIVSFSGNVLAVDILGFTLGTGTNGDATSGVSINYPDKGRTLTAVGLTSTSYSLNGLTGSGWDNNGSDGFVTNNFSTIGYLTVAVTGQIKGSNDGPKYIKAQYSLNGTNWIDVPNSLAYSDDNPTLTVTNSFASFKFRLPADCENVSNVYVRWVQNGTTSISGGTVTSSGTISMKATVVQAELLSKPTSQSTEITIVSLTPTTITLGCTPGTGNKRYIVMNTTNFFTTPSSDFIPTANSTYLGGGEQIIYAGSGTVATVTVPSSLNTYWFRYYEYNQLDNLTRYSTIDASANGNPKLCALPRIHTPVHTFGLIRATMGATIDPVSGDVSDVIDRGIFYDYNPGITTNAQYQLQEGNPSSGSFNVETEVNRGTTVYYRGYAENESGVILSEESSFNNVPVFSGTGNWEEPLKWNVKEVPGKNGDPTYGSLEDSPIIDGTCTLSASNEVTNLRINSGKKLTVSPTTLMKVDGTLTNNAGTNGLLIKSSSSEANGSLIFANGTPQASIEMYSKAYWNLANTAGNKYAWQYFGIPVTSYAYSPGFSSAYVRAWDESVKNYYDIWSHRNDGTSLQLAAGSIMQPGVAYELCQQAPKTYTFTGTLINSDYSKTLQYSSDAYYKGQNMLSNPYTAAMNIANIAFGANTLQAVYLYNTGTYGDWVNSNGESTPGSGPGTYTVSTPGTAGVAGVPSQIPPMQGFLVKATANPGSISYSYNNLLKNSSQQRVKASQNKVCTTIDLKGTNFSDRMWVFVDDNCTKGFDNGYDGPKMVGLPEVSQLYGIGTDDIYQIDAVKDLNDVAIGFQPGVEKSFTLTFNHQNTDMKYSSIYLVDLIANTTTDVTVSGSQYSFTATSSDNVNRFKIIATSTSVASNKTIETDDMKVFNLGSTILVDNKLSVDGTVRVYDTTGRLLKDLNVSASLVNQINTGLSAGLYVVKVQVGSQQISKCLIVK